MVVHNIGQNEQKCLIEVEYNSHDQRNAPPQQNLKTPSSFVERMYFDCKLSGLENSQKPTLISCFNLA